MDGICPLLTVNGDPRLVASHPDGGHRCSATDPISPIDRDHQLRYCLGGEYAACPRYTAFVESHGPLGPTWGQAAPDTSFISTRLIVEAPARFALPSRPQRLGIALLAVLLLLAAGAALAWAAMGGLGGLSGPSPSPSPTATEEPTPSATVGATSSPAGSETPVSPPPAPTPTPVPAPTPLTYIVQAGDTLNAIAARYGTTAQAIMAANGLTSEIIQVGQVLVIPTD